MHLFLTQKYIVKISDEVKNQIQIARFIYGALIGGLLIFFFFTWYIIRNSAVVFNENYTNHFFYVSLPIIVFGSFAAALYVGKKRFSKFQKIKHPQPKAEHYRETLIMQGALIEMACIFSVFIAFFTFSFLPYMFFGVGLLMFIFLFPTEEKYLRYISD